MFWELWLTNFGEDRKKYLCSKNNFKAGDLVIVLDR